MMTEEMRLEMERGKKRLLDKYIELNKTAEKGGVLFAGSSLMEMFPVEKFAAEEGLRVTNRGIGGTITDELLTNIGPCILTLEPSVLFINIGTNDLSIPERPISQVMENYDRILNRVEEALPGVRIVMMAYYPVNPDAAPDYMKPVLQIRSNAKLLEANKAVEALAAKHHARYINVNAPITDAEGRLRAEYTIEGMHIREEGYRAIWPLVKEVMMEEMRAVK